MKKSKLALACAGATTAPITAQADAVLYGNMSAQLKLPQPQYWDWRRVSRDMNRRRR